MNKYNIEGDIDFYAELHKPFDTEDNEEKIEDDNNMCLITNKPLIDKHVTLNCGHKFNYIPIYNDIVNHKKKFNIMESSSEMLNTNEIRCPYCRTKQQGVLPYYKELGLKKINGVNYYLNIKQNRFNNYIYHKCEYIVPNTNLSLNSITDIPQFNNTICHMTGFQIAVYNPQNPLQPINYGDTKYYCYAHKQIIIKQYKDAEKKKAILAKKQAKELEKQTKMLEKQKAKEEAKLLKKQSTTENVVLTQIGYCIQILKTGPNKGKPCGCKIFSDNKCKRHIPKNQY
jgi:hypothetical protein